MHVVESSCLERSVCFVFIVSVLDFGIRVRGLYVLFLSYVAYGYHDPRNLVSWLLGAYCTSLTLRKANFTKECCEHRAMDSEPNCAGNRNQKNKRGNQRTNPPITPKFANVFNQKGGAQGSHAPRRPFAHPFSSTGGDVLSGLRGLSQPQQIFKHMIYQIRVNKYVTCLHIICVYIDVCDACI